MLLVMPCLDLRESDCAEHPIRLVSRLHRRPSTDSQMALHRRFNATCHAMCGFHVAAQVRKKKNGLTKK